MIYLSPLEYLFLELYNICKKCISVPLAILIFSIDFSMRI